MAFKYTKPNKNALDVMTHLQSYPYYQFFKGLPTPESELQRCEDASKKGKEGKTYFFTDFKKLSLSGKNVVTLLLVNRVTALGSEQ